MAPCYLFVKFESLVSSVERQSADTLAAHGGHFVDPKVPQCQGLKRNSKGPFVNPRQTPRGGKVVLRPRSRRVREEQTPHRLRLVPSGSGPSSGPAALPELLAATDSHNVRQLSVNLGILDSREGRARGTTASCRISPIGIGFPGYAESPDSRERRRRLRNLGRAARDGRS